MKYKYMFPIDFRKIGIIKGMCLRGWHIKHKLGTEMIIKVLVGRFFRITGQLI